MKKFIKFTVVAIAAVMFTTVLVSATVANLSDERIEISSTSYPAINCSMTMSQAEGVLALMPSNVRELCRDEYVRVKRESNGRSRFTYQGVSCRVSENGTGIDILFSYGGYTLCVWNTSWERLDVVFL